MNIILSYLDESAIVGLAFILVLFLFGRSILANITKQCDNYSQEAIKSLTQAESFLQEAETAFNEAYNNLEEAKRTAEQILKAADVDANLLLKDTKDHINELVNKKVAMAAARIARHEEQIIHHLKVAAVKKAFEIITTKLMNDLSQETKASMCQKAFDKIENTGVSCSIAANQ